MFTDTSMICLNFVAIIMIDIIMMERICIIFVDFHTTTAPIHQDLLFATTSLTLTKSGVALAWYVFTIQLPR